MAEEEWKVLVRQQVGEAIVYCNRAHGLLADSHGLLAKAQRDLQTRALADDPRAWRAWAQRAEDNLADVSGELAAAASLMAAAGLIAPRGAAPPSPAAPRGSIGDVPGEALRIALGQLQNARDGAESACDFVDVCRAHLSGLRRLLGHPHLPGSKGLAKVKFVAASDDLDSARKLEQGSTLLVYEALLSLDSLPL